MQTCGSQSGALAKPCWSILDGDSGTEKSVISKEMNEEGMAFPTMDSSVVPHPFGP